jgi:non-specific serine/threonine protein kinase
MRAQSVRPDLVLTPANATAIALICERLDGLPLAIELAATRIRVLPPQELLTRLDQRLSMLTGGSVDRPTHQQTLRATMDWSYSLLGASYRSLFRRLAVFVDGCTLDAAKAIACEGDDSSLDVLNGMQTLIEHSLVQQHLLPNGEPRFSMLETIREYGLEQLTTNREGETTRLQHAMYYLQLAEQASPLMRSPAQRVWYERLDIEHANLSAALDWTVGQLEALLGLQFAVALWEYWLRRGYLSEGRAWILAAFAKCERESSCDQACTTSFAMLRAEALTGVGHLAWSQGDFQAARTALEESIALYQAVGDVRGRAEAISGLGIISGLQGEFGTAYELFKKQRDLYAELGDIRGCAEALANMGRTLLEDGDLAGAQELLELSLIRYQTVGDTRGIAFVLDNSGRVAMEQGDYRRGITLLNESIELSQELGDKWLMMDCLENLAGGAMVQGQPLVAARLWGAAAVLREALGAPMSQAEHQRFERAQAHVHAPLNEAAWQEGRAMSVERVVAYAKQIMSDLHQVANPSALHPSPGTSHYPSGLTEREVKVLRLVAQGLTDKEVAEHLIISPRTVHAHLQSIYGKLSVSSRTAAARFAIDHGLL